MQAGEEADLLVGENGDDELYGGTGDDVSIGGKGVNFFWLWGWKWYTSRFWSR